MLKRIETLLTFEGTHDIQLYPVPDSHTFLVDTPGFDDPAHSDADTLESIASLLSDLWEALVFDRVVSLIGVLYLHSIPDARADRAFVRNLGVLRGIVGDEGMRRVVFVTTKWNLGQPVRNEEHEIELMTKDHYWRDALARGAHVMRFNGSRASAHSITDVLVGKAEDEDAFLPVLTREYAIQKLPLNQTKVGRAVGDALVAEMDKQRETLRTLREEHTRALQAGEAKLAAMIEKRTAAAHAKMTSLEDDMAQLRADREQVQVRDDTLDALSTTTWNEASYETASERHRRRWKRATRWFGRLAALGTTVALGVLTYGAMAPIGLALWGVLEAHAQAQKSRETDRRLARAQQRSLLPRVSSSQGGSAGDSR